MGMMQNIQAFREQTQAMIDSDSANKSLDILALAINPPEGPAHPGAYPHIVLEVLERAGDLPRRDKLKKAFEEFPSNPLKAMIKVYSQG